jgi:predicted phosphoribosyltransferase
MDAGRQLAVRLSDLQARSDVVVLALPRGGVPVAFEIASSLGVPLDVFLVRKLGAPMQPELAIGAVAAGGVEVLSPDLIRDLGIPAAVIQQIAVRERMELDRRDQLFRIGRPPLDVSGRIAVLVDDGLATGATMEAAILSLRRMGPASIVAAVPVGAPETCERIARLVDRMVCLATPEPFDAVGQWYTDFSQTTDEEVRRLLQSAPPV